MLGESLAHIAFLMPIIASSGTDVRSSLFTRSHIFCIYPVNSFTARIEAPRLTSMSLGAFQYEIKPTMSKFTVIPTVIVKVGNFPYL